MTEPASPLWTSLDRYVDVDALRSLDEPLTGRLRELEAQHAIWPSRFVSWYTEHLSPEEKPKTLYLTHKPNCTTYSEQMRDQRGFHPTREAPLFGDLLAFVETLPFEYTGRILLVFDDQGLDTPPHLDHTDPDWRQEFVWFRTNLHKRFYLLTDTDEKVFVDSYSAWFDTGKVRHGVEGREGLSLSMRVDGVFTPEFRAELGWVDALAGG